MGLSDGINKLWIMKMNRGLDVDGFKNRLEAIAYLIRCEMLDDHSDTSKARVRASVATALSHMDDPVTDDDDDDKLDDESDTEDGSVVDEHDEI